VEVGSDNPNTRKMRRRRRRGGHSKYCSDGMMAG